MGLVVRTINCSLFVRFFALFFQFAVDLNFVQCWKVRLRAILGRLKVPTSRILSSKEDSQFLDQR